jgi:hypothetical protein
LPAPSRLKRCPRKFMRLAAVWIVLGSRKPSIIRSG